MFFRKKTVAEALKNFRPIENNKRISESTSASAERYKQLTNPEYAEKVFLKKMQHNIGMQSIVAQDKIILDENKNMFD
ncbi:hypothetical protein OR571_11395 [Psychrobacillus sp. NEAU-3TGS]|uniref:hypothetical protein n=1 Tax=Psychrobacillus sp. NEAU-3TGS TaxID=2995412 RepID=UPI002496F3DE|nr:hypothetical protein [Psychrobacillus sp. NEAU-3TGS]MDI2587702.1 hypothetical protein [Psychrobacillus sp. NEAU-3TGS]